MEKKETRLRSLDLLRGMDLFLLVCLQPILFAILTPFSGQAFADFVLTQLTHEEWTGFRFWDLVMPLFLFMTGVAMPFSFAKYAGEGRKMAYLKRVIIRVLVLFFLGMIVQGNLLSLNPKNFVYYSNTLQAIAIGYLITSIALLTLSQRKQIILAAVLLIIYWVPMTFCGDFTLEGNFANQVDACIMGIHRGDPSYTWIWSSLNFGVTVLLGAFAGQLLRSTSDKKAAFKQLMTIGAILIVAGLLWSLQMPIIKRLWTSSMTLFSGGLCYILLALVYHLVDIQKRTRGLMWLAYFGMNSITAYMIGEWLKFRGLVDQFTFGLEPYVGDFYYCILTIGNALIVFLILKALYKSDIFLKV